MSDNESANLISEIQKSYGIIPVMPFGSPIDFTPYRDFEDVIIDAAASLGSLPPTFSTMKNTWAVVYSLHATKVLGAGEGAIVVCGNSTQAESLRAWSNFGFSSNRTSDIQGTNAKMSEMSAAYGLYSIQNIEVERIDWLESQECVALQSKDCVWSTFVNSIPQFHPYWIASFKDEEEKSRVTDKLSDAGIQVREWWAKPLSMQNAFAKAKLISENTNAKWLASVHLGLPMFKGLRADSVSEIVNVVKTGLKS